MKLLILTAICFIVSTSSINGFDSPTCGDPWYHQDNSRPVFWIPDKVQHYWGSYTLSVIGQKYLGDKVGPPTAFVLGILWEIKDSKTSLGTPNGGVVGFSYRDLIADGVGVVSSLVNQSKDVRLWLDYSTLNKEIMLNMTILL